jgi:SAM-dependent methyltransferase
MFQKTLKKKLRLTALKAYLGRPANDDACLLVTCGDNNGAINYFLKLAGGRWSWADLEDKSIAEMSGLLNDPVVHVEESRLPFETDQFDIVVSIDVHEHLSDPNPFTKELSRVAKPGGKILVTVPNGDETKLVVRIKNIVGMTKEKYGHHRTGLTIGELKSIYRDNRIQPTAEGSFSKFFTEMLELSINFLYVKILSKKSDAVVDDGTIAPATEDQLKSVKKSYQIYSMIYPIFWLISKLDFIFFRSIGYVVIVEGRKVGPD